jgi:hypothetical protein
MLSKKRGDDGVLSGVPSSVHLSFLDDLTATDTNSVLHPTRLLHNFVFCFCFLPAADGVF